MARPRAPLEVLEEESVEEESAEGAPESYDSRAAFPHCAGTIGRQGSCSASAAFSVASMTAERLCRALPQGAPPLGDHGR